MEHLIEVGHHNLTKIHFGPNRFWETGFRSTDRRSHIDALWRRIHNKITEYTNKSAMCWQGEK